MLYTASNNLRSWRTTSSGGSVVSNMSVSEIRSRQAGSSGSMPGNKPCSEHHLVQVLLAEGVKDLQGRGLNRLDTAVSKEHQAQVRPLRVLGVGEHGSSRAGVGNTLVPKRDHLVQRRRSVAHLTKGLPQNAGKTLPV
jgi:hypothetical protein